MDENRLPRLQLPRRWEILLDRAQDAGVDPSDLVEKVASAGSRVDTLLSRIGSGSGGVFELFLGKSDSGKTTFVKSLPKFFDNIKIFSVAPDFDLRDLPSFVVQMSPSRGDSYAVFLIERRDNPSTSDVESAREIFSAWLDFFRSRAGNIVVLWTITDEDAAKKLANSAWSVGRDSICAIDTKGIFHFRGLERQKYYPVADNTALNLSGDGLEAYGVSKDVARDLIAQSETISDFYQLVVQKSEEKRGQAWSTLKERGQPRLWIMLHGDDRSAIGQTVGSLTQGSHSQIDIARILDTIDDPENAATYAKQWRERRSNVGQLLRSIDVRVFAVPPNVSVQAVRCFGDVVTKAALVSKTAAKTSAASALRATSVYKELLATLGESPIQARTSGRIAPSTIDEYRRIQALARNNDEKLNHAIGELFKHTLQEDGYEVEVFTEKRSVTIAGIQPDIAVKIGDGEFVCLEPTWRTSANVATVPDVEAERRQSTLSEGHIKPYVLEKALKYIAALEL